MTAEEITKLDPYEGYPNVYNRLPITLNVYHKNASIQVRGEAYVQVNPSVFTDPCDKYKIACTKTIYLSRLLRDLVSENAQNADIIELEVINGLDHNNRSTFKYQLSKEDRDNI